jgi:DNA-binding GntR family transcriptional regulator
MNLKTPPLVVQDVTRYLRNEIVSGKLKGGKKLTEISLQKRWGISRSPIREALRILEQEGLVVLVPRKGAYVSEITVDELKDTTIVVAALEGLASRLALPNLKNQDFKKMRELLRKMEKEVSDFLVDGYTRTHNDFHETFVSRSKNAVLIDTLAKLRNRYVRPVVTSYYFLHNIKDAINGHLKILDALKKGDPEEVENVVRSHVLYGLAEKKDFDENFQDSLKIHIEGIAGILDS